LRGRKPKPLKRQISEGDTRKKGVRKLKQALAAEPKATRGLPECPTHLTGLAKTAWKFWSKELREMKLDCRPDAVMLEGACVGYARAVAADLLIAKVGSVVAEPVLGKEGELLGCKYKTYPAVTISKAAWSQVRSFCSEFGLSPVSRTRLAMEKPDTGESDLMAMLSAPREPRKQQVQ
jgi:P27 family predicted phage terminase small subunit